MLLSERPYETLAGQPFEFVLGADDDNSVVTVMVDTTGTVGTVYTENLTEPGQSRGGQFQFQFKAVYTPAEGFVGTDFFTVTVTDADGLTASQMLTINVVAEQAEDEELPPEEELPPLTGELIINYNPQMSEADIALMLEELGAVEVERIPAIGVMRINVQEGMGAAMATNQVRSMGRAALSSVTVEDPVTLRIQGYVPFDEYWTNGDQWGVGGSNSDTNYEFGTWAITPDQGVDGAWEYGAYNVGNGITVAVLDTGVPLDTHPDFVGRLTTARYDFVNDDPNPEDDMGHGSQVAGIIVANGDWYSPTDAASGIVGMAPLAKVLPVKVCDSNGDCGDFTVAQGIVYAVDNGANILNLSFGSCNESSSVRGAVQYALSRGVVVVAGSGNGDDTACFGNPSNPNGYSYPASYDGVISVAAHRKDGISGAAINGYNVNDKITVSAPGLEITAPSHPAGTYPSGSGTSLAAAHVSGTAALLMGAQVATTPDTVHEAILCGADTSVPSYDSDIHGAGIVRAHWSMTWKFNSGSCNITLPNDDFEQALTLPSLPYVEDIPFSERSVTRQPSDPATYPDPAANPDAPQPDLQDSYCGTYPTQTVWYKFTEVAAKHYLVSTLGSRRANNGEFDTVIGIFTGSPGNLVSIGCNDNTGADIVDEGSLTSQLVFGTEPGLTYYIMVGFSDPSGGWNSETNPAEQQLNFVDSGTLSFDFRPVVSTVGENAYFASWGNETQLVGSWTAESDPGSFSSGVMRTYQDSAIATFAVRGSVIDIWRTIGPNIGNIKVILDGTTITSINNSAAQRAGSALVTLDLSLYDAALKPNEWHTITLLRDSTGPAGPIELNWFRVRDGTADVYSLLQDSPVNFLMDNYWEVVSPNAGWVLFDGDSWQDDTVSGAYPPTAIPGVAPLANTVKKAVPGNPIDPPYATFRFVGDGVIIYRSIGPTAMSMDIYVDGLWYERVSNAYDSEQAFVPYSITDLTYASHTVEIFAVPGGTDLKFDAFQPTNFLESYILGVYDANLAGYKTLYADTGWSPKTPQYIYPSGFWFEEASPVGGTTGTTVLSTQDDMATLDMEFYGNRFCVYYVEHPTGGIIDVYVDEFLRDQYSGDDVTNPQPAFSIDTFNAGGAVLRGNCSSFPTTHHSDQEGGPDPLGMLSTTYHQVQLVTRLDPGEKVIVDSMPIYSYDFLTSSDGLVYYLYSVTPFASQFLYEPDEWNFQSTPLASPGGYNDNASELLWFMDFQSQELGGDELITFYMEGSGFVLYTAIGGNHGTWEVFVDGVKQTFSHVDPITGNGVTRDYINLSFVPYGGTGFRTTPFAFVIDDLGPGIHKVTLVARMADETNADDTAREVHFGGVQIIP
jgi:hypothetical protein